MTCDTLVPGGGEGAKASGGGDGGPSTPVEGSTGGAGGLGPSKGDSGSCPNPVGGEGGCGLFMSRSVDVWTKCQWLLWSKLKLFP